jgi:hypothetical protein
MQIVTRREILRVHGYRISSRDFTWSVDCKFYITFHTFVLPDFILSAFKEEPPKLTLNFLKSM